LFDALQRTPACLAAEALQRASPLPQESLVAAGPVTGMIEKTLG